MVYNAMDIKQKVHVKDSDMIRNKRVFQLISLACFVISGPHSMMEKLGNSFAFN